MLLLRQERMAGKGTRSDANERHVYPFIRTLRQRSLHGPIKINVSVSGSITVSVSVSVQCVNALFISTFSIFAVSVSVLVSVRMESPLKSPSREGPIKQQQQQENPLLTVDCLIPHYLFQLSRFLPYTCIRTNGSPLKSPSREGPIKQQQQQQQENPLLTSIV